MGCCSSSVVKSPVTKMDVEITPTVKTEPECNEIATPDMIKMEIIIPRPKSLSEEMILTTAENSDDSGKSVSPTGVAQRSRRKSVTFNPISTVKEYRRDSSSVDKDYITYFCEQLGFDTLSDTDSTDGIDDEFDEADHDHHIFHDTVSRSPNYSPTFLNHTMLDEDEELLRYEAELLRESEIDPSDPRYVHDYDIEYDPDYRSFHSGSGSGRHGFRENCVWACS